MNDEQIEHLKKLMKNGNRIAWFDGEHYREIIRIGLKIVDDEPDTEEMAGVFNDGKYVDLYNVDEFDIVTIHTAPIFPSYSKDRI